MIDINSIQSSPHLLDTLLQIEDVLDSLDTYVFENWLDGEVVEGPNMKRYWVNLTLCYPYNKMPDPKAALRLLKHGVRVDYSKARFENDDFNKIDDNDEDGELYWLVKISVPRRLIVDINAAQLDF